MKTDPRIDAYIARQADFARPILEHLRAAVHAACPDCEETMKWSSPTFMYKGGMLAGMAAFKAHATFGFWKGALVTGDTAEQMSAMGQFGRLTAVGDLPAPATLEALVKKAMALADAGVKAPRNKHPKAPFTVPDDLRAALDGKPPPRRPSTAFHRAPSATMSSGSPRRSARRPAPSASPRRWNGWRKASAATGNMRIAER